MTGLETADNEAIPEDAAYYRIEQGDTDVPLRGDILTPDFEMIPRVQPGSRLPGYGGARLSATVQRMRYSTAGTIAPSAAGSRLSLIGTSVDPGRCASLSKS